MDAPTKEDVIERLRRLLDGSLTRAEIASWAYGWVVGDASIADEAIWDTLNALAMVELPGGDDREYLYVETDFHAWLDDIEGAPEDAPGPSTEHGKPVV